MKRRRKGAVTKRRSPRSVRHFVPPRTVEEFFALPEPTQDIYTHVTHAISQMRSDRVSLSHAAREYGVTRRQIQRIGEKALLKQKNARYAARAVDRLLRVLVIPTPTGIREIAVTDSRQASLLGRYWNSVQQYLETGNTSGLQEFQGKQIKTAEGTTIPVLTDLRELDRLASAGVLSFQSIYGRAA